MKGPLLPVSACAVLSENTHLGKRAIKGEHRALLPQLDYSTDLEAAAKAWGIDHALKRWDYLAHGKRTKRWVAVEVHQANPTELIQKKADTERFLRERCPPVCEAIKAWHVCAKGEISPTARRRLADKSILISRNLIDTL